MIPVKLELYNFLAYCQPEPLDLSGLHLACLAGANGAGKSSLLDAITWALWGKARARRDDDLIHGNEEEMQVRLTFLLEGNCYRITRYRSRQGRGVSLLELEVQDGAEWRSISENTIRATQDKITRLLRLDYSTFINSAFLVQGRADEFTKKPAGERKAILGEILGLDVWTIYEGRVKTRLHEIEQERDQNESQIKQIDEELGREVEYLRDLNAAQQVLASLSDQVREAEARVHTLEDARREHSRLLAEQDRVTQRIQQVEDELKAIEKDYNASEERLGGFQDVLAARGEIEAGYATLQAIRQEARDLSERLQAHSDLRMHQSDLQREIEIARSELQAEQREKEHRRAELARKLAERAGERQSLEDVEARIVQFEEQERQCGEWGERLSVFREERAKLESVNETLRIEMEKLKQQIQEIESATEPMCPLCGQELSENHRAELLERLRQEGTQKGDTFRANRERLDELTIEIDRLAHEIEEAKSELRNLDPLRKYAAQLNERLAQAAADQEELGQVEARLAELDAVLSNQDYAHEAQAKLADIQMQLSELGYDDQAYQQVRARLGEYESFEARKRDLDRALDVTPEIEAKLAQLSERFSDLEAQRDKDCAVADSLGVQIEALNQQLRDLPEAKQALEELRDEYAQAQYRAGAAQQRVNALEQQRHRRAELVARNDQLGTECSIYTDLRTAFGKGGIPAMIIEAAIPEIEEEANQILSRMTDGRMHVRFETQREKVTGGTKETLDIRIADELGTRDYETFSGGEAFRVNFAIRLALSRLLARRAGAQLRTLIIDEGFGTQDAQGRERLVEAINVIQDEFDLILVITHIDELRDAFPVRIEVTKTRNGSVIEVT